MVTLAYRSQWYATKIHAAAGTIATMRPYTPRQTSQSTTNPAAIVTICKGQTSVLRNSNSR